MKLKLNGTEWRVTSKFGEIDSWHPRPHTGIDLAIPQGVKLHSPVDGVVEKVVDYGSKNVGKGVFIRTEEGERLILGHLSDNSFVKPGQIINKGDLLGLTGNTGRSSGPHLHIGLQDQNNKFISPEKYLGDAPQYVAAPKPDVTIFKPDVTNLFEQVMQKFTEGILEIKLQFIQSLYIHTKPLVLDLILSLLC